MTQRERIEALREEVAELQKQVAALSVAIAQVAVARPYADVPLPAPQPFPVTPWRSPNICQFAALGTVKVRLNGNALAGGI